MSAPPDPAATEVALGPRLEARHALTPTQRDIWAAQRLHPDTPLANMGKRHRMLGRIDPGRLVAAFDAVVRASPMLRSVFGPDERRVLATPPRATEVVDLDPADLDRWCRDRIATPIDATACCYDSVLLRHADDDWTWWLDLHHLVTDAWSSAVVFEATADAYERLGAGAPVDDVDGDVLGLLDLADVVVAPAPDDPGVRRRAAAWADDAARAGDQPPFAPYGPRGTRTTEVDRAPVAVDAAALRRALATRYRSVSEELSLLGVLAAVAGALAARTDGRTSMTVGVPVHHRTGRRAPRAIGPMMEIVPLRFAVEADDTFTTLVERVRGALLEVLKRARPGERPSGDVDVIVNVLHARYGTFGGIETATEWMRSGHVEPGHVLRLQAYDYGDDLRVEADVQRSLADAGWQRALPDHVAALLAAAIEQPDTGLADIDLLTDRDRSDLAPLNPPLGTGGARRDVPVHLLVQERLRADPAAIVVDHGDDRCDAATFDALADRVARSVLRLGSGGVRVGLRMRRSIELLAAVHGTMRAGASFVLLDPDDPPHRHDEIAADAGLAVVVDDLDDLPVEPGTERAADVSDASPHDAIADLDRADLDRADLDGVDLDRVDLDREAYLLYTSGSTGAPKGVPISHRGLADYLAFAVDTYVTDRGVDGADVVMPFHSRTVFDLTITSMFLPMLVGGLTVVVDGDGVEALSAVAADERINVLKATPSQLEVLTRMIEGPGAIHTVIVGGEAFRRPVAVALAERCADDVAIYNEYGPTEAVVGCMIHRFDPDFDRGADVPIGAACPGAEVHLLDRAGRPALPGSWGELFVARPGMAEGYLHRPELTATRFLRLPAVSDALLYRTGDRARLVRPGVLVYGGRDDDQLSVGGVRLEPGEVEAALVAHPDVDNAVVRLWRHRRSTVRRCVRCGLGDDVPGVTIDDGVCSTCRRFDVVAPQAAAWFRDDDDLAQRLESARARRRGDVDALHLLSGGKDSTYALYQLVERGWRLHALTLDNGYISEGAIDNIRRTVADLGIGHEFVRTDAMAEIFRDSLDRHANVCNGCYKTIYTLAIARARELGIPTIVTGLSRGQFFETRLVPHQFESDRFDPDAIDATVLEARRVYHATRDAVTESLPEQAVFDVGDPLAELEFVDFYRYVDVDLDELYDFLDRRAPWVRPADTGRSTNCLINDVGIWVHRHERGYHNYAEPYSWDVRLGHKTRAGALDELDDDIDEAAVQRMLAEIGYQPKTGGVLTAWYQTANGAEIDPSALRAHLRDRLPERAIPTAFVRIDAVPLAASAKVDVDALPEPTRFHRSRTGGVAPTGATEEYLVAVWQDVLGLDAVGVTDDFFDLGGASLAALEVVARIDDDLGVDLPDAALFRHRTIAELAVEIDRTPSGPAMATGQIPPVDAGSPAPVSPGEEAMLLEHLADPSDVRYHVARHYTVAGAIDADRLAVAVADVVARHGPLHTAFDHDRTVLTDADAVTFGRLPAPGPDTDLVEVMTDLARAPFDLRRGPLVRVHVGDPTETERGLRTDVLVVVHHVAVDAATFDLLWSEIGAAYAGDPLPELTVSAAAHAAWQRDHAGVHAAYWSERRRAGEPSTPTLAPPATPGDDGYLYRTAPLSRSELRAGPGTTPFATALAAAVLTLGRRSRSERVDLGVMASTKDHHDVAPLVGYFLNTLPLAVDVPVDGTLADVARRADRVIGEAIAHRTYPFAEMVRDARRDGEPEPAIAHMLAYEQLAPSSFGGLPADHRILPLGASVADATFFVEERPDSVRIALEHRGAAVGASAAEDLLDEFGRTLEALCRDPSMPVATWWAAAASTDLVGEELPAELPTVVARIVEAVIARPTAIAVEGRGFELSYRELLGRAAGVADAILASPTPPARVGVACHRDDHLVPAILGSMLAGAAYVPLDPTMPDGRLTELAESAGLDAVVADGAPPFRVPASVHTVDIGDLDIGDLDIGDLDVGAVERAARLAAGIGGDDPAYVIFTSGTTGRPAGIAATHDNLAASTAARTRWYGDAERDRPERFLLTSSIGFDSSLVGLVWPLATGGTIVLAADDEVHDLDRLAACAERHRVTHALMVPSLYRALVARRPDALSDLRVAVVAGEACPPELVHEHAAAVPGARLVNEYGPTETTVWASVAELTPGRPVTIGGPIAGTRLRIADDRGRPLPQGSTGELWIAGRGVTIGYVGAATRDAFVEVDGARWYRTGDLVRLVDGELWFTGRLDDQLNVGGARVEPAELESALRSATGVLEAVVVSATVGGREALVAHVERGGVEPDPTALRSSLAARFPAAVVPRRIVVHDRLPRNVHGKLDRRAASRLSVPVVAPVPESSPGRSLDLGVMLSIWRSALARPDVAADDDFFELGGDSLSAVEIVTSVEELLGREIAITTLLVSPTPRRFVDHVLADCRDDRAGDGTDGDPGRAVDLVRLRPGEPGGPTVIMTAAWDDVFGYQALADALPASMRVVAVARRSADHRYDRVGPLTEATLAALERDGLAAPGLVVVGWSVGGLVAHELGAALLADGRPPVVVALVDTYFAGEQRHLWSNRWWKYRSLVTHRAIGEIVSELATMLRRRTRRLDAWVRRRVPLLAERVPEAPSRPRASVPPAALDHDMSDRPARTILYAADGTNRARTEHRWRTVVPELIVVPVRGRHRGAASIMGADRVHQVADHLAGFVGVAAGADPGRSRG